MVGKVDGVFTADPTKDKNAKLLERENQPAKLGRKKKYLAGSEWNRRYWWMST